MNGVQQLHSHLCQTGQRSWRSTAEFKKACRREAAAALSESGQATIFVFLLEKSAEEEMFLPCLGLLVPTDPLIPGDRSQLSLLRSFGSLAELSQKKTWVPNAQHLILEAPVSKSAAGTAFLVGCFGIAGARQNLEAKQTLF